MELKDISCPSCGAVLLIGSDCKGIVTCEYCGKKFILNDGTQKVEHYVPETEEIGYNFEKGKIRARNEEYKKQQDLAQERYNKQKEEQKRKLLVKALMWLLFFPVMLIFTIVKSSRFDTETKIFAVVIIIGAVIYFMSGGRLWS